jgi:hypothetical protein
VRHDQAVSGASFSIEEVPPTWVSIPDAARYAGVSRAAVERAVSAGRVRTKQEGRARSVALESVLNATLPSDIERLRKRIERAAAWEGAHPDVVREWGQAMRDLLFPILDQLVAAEKRAALAEARLEECRRRSGGPSS